MSAVARGPGCGVYVDMHASPVIFIKAVSDMWNG